MRLVARTLVAVGVATWCVAQFLPATEASLSPPDGTIGFMATLMGWGVAEPYGLLAWSANVWFACSLISWRARHLGLAWFLTALAVICAAYGVYVMATGWPYLLTDFPPLVGAWVWIGAMVVNLVAVTVGCTDEVIANYRRRHHPA